MPRPRKVINPGRIFQKRRQDPPKLIDNSLVPIYKQYLLLNDPDFRPPPSPPAPPRPLPTIPVIESFIIARHYNLRTDTTGIIHINNEHGHKNSIQWLIDPSNPYVLSHPVGPPPRRGFLFGLCEIHPPAFTNPLIAPFLVFNQRTSPAYFFQTTVEFSAPRYNLERQVPQTVLFSSNDFLPTESILNYRYELQFFGPSGVIYSFMFQPQPLIDDPPDDIVIYNYETQLPLYFSPGSSLITSL